MSRFLQMKSPGLRMISSRNHVALKLKQEDITQIVFSGGGVRGIAYAGVFRSLAERGILDRINKVAGTSAGSIAALFLALNFPAAELQTMLETLDVSIFRDQTLLGKPELGYNLVEYLGMYSGETLLNYLKEKIVERTGLSPDVTLAEFDTFSSGQAPSGEQPQAPAGSDSKPPAGSDSKPPAGSDQSSTWVYRKFSCVGTKKNTGTETVISAETYPDMPLALAVRISCSIPFYFQPVMWPLGSGQYWEDGGLLDNYDLSIWDTKINDDEDVRYIPNMHTLGFRLFNETDQRDANFHYREFQVTNLYDSLVAFVNTLLDQSDRIGIREEFWERTVSIRTGDISAVDFDLTPEKKAFLVSSGYESTEKFLNEL